MDYISPVFSLLVNVVMMNCNVFGLSMHHRVLG